MPLYDVVAAGISFVFPARERLKVGDEFTGSVQVPGCEQLLVRVEVRNIRPFGRQEQQYGVVSLNWRQGHGSVGSGAWLS